MKAIHKKRLLNVAKALRESANPKAFDMRGFTYGDAWLESVEQRASVGDGITTMVGPAFSCGTPACALGHYAARRDLQRAFKIRTAGPDAWVGGIDGGYDSQSVRRHFGFKEPPEVAVGDEGSEVDELFAPEGCGRAKTAKQAARYIENFVKRKEREAVKR